MACNGLYACTTSTTLCCAAMYAKPCPMFPAQLHWGNLISTAARHKWKGREGKTGGEINIACASQGFFFFAILGKNNYRGGLTEKCHIQSIALYTTVATVGAGAGGAIATEAAIATTAAAITTTATAAAITTAKTTLTAI